MTQAASLPFRFCIPTTRLLHFWNTNSALREYDFRVSARVHSGFRVYAPPIHPSMVRMAMARRGSRRFFTAACNGVAISRLQSAMARSSLPPPHPHPHHPGVSPATAPTPSHSSFFARWQRSMQTTTIAGEADGEALLVRYLEKLRNYEKEGVPRGAGTDSADGFDLERMRRLLMRLGNPLSAYLVVHVAGTKGKGSTVNFLSSILRAAGLSVGTYTSPHVTSIRERLSAGKSGEPVSAVSLRKLVTDVQAIIDEDIAAESGLLTHFEVLTALAFTHFAREKVDVAVVETGLGGARDATNVISAEGLALAVIVGIGFEHLAALGGTLESIALAKAGIIKENRPVIVGPQRDSQVYGIIEKVAAAKGAPLIAVSRSMVKSKTGILFTCTGRPYQFCDMIIPYPPGPQFEASQKEWKLGNVKLRALGAHQQDNALTAVSAVLALRSRGWQISDSAIRIGLENTEMPGRFQVIGSDSSKALGCLSARLILDGAHTEESAMALAKTIRDGFPSARLAFVVAMASDKDQRSFARSLLTDAKPNVVVTTRVPVAGSYDRSCTAEELAECWTHEMSEPSLGQPSQVRPCIESVDANASGIDGEDNQRNGELLVVLSVELVQDAIRTAAAELESRHSESGQPLIVCVAGSLHVVAATLALIQDKQIQQ